MQQLKSSAAGLGDPTLLRREGQWPVAPASRTRCHEKSSAARSAPHTGKDCPLPSPRRSRHQPTRAHHRPTPGSEPVGKRRTLLPADSPLPTTVWLETCGLPALGLGLQHWLPSIGFRHCQEYVNALCRRVQAEYSNGLFERCPMPDGSVYNVALDTKQVLGYEQRLDNALRHLRERMRWLTSSSRLVLGRSQEPVVTVVLHLSGVRSDSLRPYRQVLGDLVTHQLAVTQSFNLLRSGGYVTDAWAQAVQATDLATLHAAHEWVSMLQPLEDDEKPDLLDALEQAWEEGAACPAILLVVDGPVVGQHQLVLRKAAEQHTRIHIAAINLQRHDDTLRFLRELARTTGGLLHSFRGELSDAAHNTGIGDCRGDNAEVQLLRNEINYASTTLATLRALMLEHNERRYRLQAAKAETISLVKTVPSPAADVDLPVVEWLARHGVRARKVLLTDMLRPFWYPHASANVAILDGGPHPVQTPVHAIVCRSLNHYRTPDDTLVHISFPPTAFAACAAKVARTVDIITARRQHRLKELGSRVQLDLGIRDGGTLVVLLDASGAMLGPLWTQLTSFVKQVLREQLTEAQKFNLVVLADPPAVWAADGPRVAGPSEVENACTWLLALQPYGTVRNLRGAWDLIMGWSGVDVVALAMADRPCQDEMELLGRVEAAAVHLQCHTLSLAPDNITLNTFLQDMAKIGRGWFRYLSWPSVPGVPTKPDPLPTPTQSPGHPDIAQLTAELSMAHEQLVALEGVYQECSRNDVLRRAGRDTELVYQYTERPPELRAKGSGRSLELSLVSSTTKTEIDTKLPAGERPGWDKYSKPGTRKHCEPSIHLPASHCVGSRPSLATLSERQGMDAVPITKWLASYSLDVQGLTIEDALAATVVLHQGKYVPILGKVVYGKVFEGVLTCYPAVDTDNGQVSSVVQTIRLVNPLAAHLEDYEKRLLRARDRLFRRWRKLVLPQLPDEQREAAEHLNGETLRKVLDDWTTESDQADSKRLQQEIILADSYLLESQRLRAECKDATARKKLQQTALAVVPPGKAHRRRRAAPVVPIVSQPDGVDDSVDGPNYSKDEPLELQSLAEANGCELQAMNETGGLGTKDDQDDLIWVWWRRPVDDIPLLWLDTAQQRDRDTFIPGAIVLARAKDSGYYVHGTVQEMDDAGYFLVAASDQCYTELVFASLGRNMVLLPPLPATELLAGDHVMVPGIVQGAMVFAPAMVEGQEEGDSGHSDAVFYRCTAFNGEQHVTSCHHVVPISSLVHTHICRQLLRVLHRRQQESQTDSDNADVTSAAAAATVVEDIRVGLNKQDGPHTRRLNSFSPTAHLEASWTPLSPTRHVGHSHGGSLEYKLARPMPSRQAVFPHWGRTLAIIASSDSGHELRDQLFARVQRYGLSVLVEQSARLSARQAREFLWEHKNSPAFASLVDCFAAGQATVAVLTGTDALALWLAIIEETDCPPLTVFGSFTPQQVESETALFFEQLTPDRPAATPKLVGTLMAGQRVLYRWPRNGWFFVGTLVDYITPSTVCVQDVGGTREPVGVADVVVLATGSPLPTMGEAVLAEHPLYQNSYAPGKAQRIDPDGGILVVFYDRSATRCTATNCCCLPQPEQYTALVDSIVALEKSMLGQRVLARYEADGLFYEGVVTERVGNGHEYCVLLDDGFLITAQESGHVFTKHLLLERGLASGDHVLALYFRGLPGMEYEHNIFAPAKIISAEGTTAIVKFWDGRTVAVPQASLLPLSLDDYTLAIEYIRQREGEKDQKESHLDH